ncbi:hypothetical protein ACFVRD_37445 [Streptomyces sp. NPDC057908]|uniref:hypothetical protein n=1 Tax=Streptomyces sp. NPDC057908 TaxID=3346276 RepID=UPI0036F1135F
MVVAQLVHRLPTSGALAFIHPRDFYERAYSRHRIRSKVKPLAVTALVGESAVKLGLDDGASIEDREQL